MINQNEIFIKKQLLVVHNNLASVYFNSPANEATSIDPSTPISVFRWDKAEPFLRFREEMCIWQDKNECLSRVTTVMFFRGCSPPLFVSLLSTDRSKHLIFENQSEKYINLSSAGSISLELLCI